VLLTGAFLQVTPSAKHPYSQTAEQVGVTTQVLFIQLCPTVQGGLLKSHPEGVEIQVLLTQTCPNEHDGLL